MELFSKAFTLTLGVSMQKIGETSRHFPVGTCLLVTLLFPVRLSPGHLLHGHLLLLPAHNCRPRLIVLWQNRKTYLTCSVIASNRSTWWSLDFCLPPALLFSELIYRLIWDPVFQPPRTMAASPFTEWQPVPVKGLTQGIVQCGTSLYKTLFATIFSCSYWS